MERASKIYENFTFEDLKKLESKPADSVKKVDYMTVYTSELVEAVRIAAGNMGNIPFRCFIPIHTQSIHI